MSDIVLTYEARPVSQNDYRRRPWSERSAHDQEWRTAFWGIANRECGRLRLERVGVEVFAEFTSSLQDPVNCYPSVKAAIDGIVKARLIPDDTGEHVVYVRFWPPCKSERNALTLKLIDNP